jgi:hypothetical protein
MRDFDGKPFLGTYTPQDYYNTCLGINPYMAKRTTQEACLNSGTSEYNPINYAYAVDPMEWKFTPLPEETLKNLNFKICPMSTDKFEPIKSGFREGKEKIFKEWAEKQANLIEVKMELKRYMSCRENEEFKKSIWYKIYKFFGGY